MPNARLCRDWRGGIRCRCVGRVAGKRRAARARAHIIPRTRESLLAVVGLAVLLAVGGAVEEEGASLLEVQHAEGDLLVRQVEDHAAAHQAQ